MWLILILKSAESRLRSGDRVSADLRLVDAVNLWIDSRAFGDPGCACVASGNGGNQPVCG